MAVMVEKVTVLSATMISVMMLDHTAILKAQFMILSTVVQNQLTTVQRTEKEMGVVNGLLWVVMQEKFQESYVMPS